MHLKRNKAAKKLPIPRKGTTFVARASSHIKNSVPVLIALRDMLKLARNAREVKKMINQKLIKINGRTVKDVRESIKLYNILQADKAYVLTLSSTKKFYLEETKDKEKRLCKVTGKTRTKNNKIQLNLHDGSNVLSDDKINIDDSLYLDLSGKIKENIPLEKGKDIIVLFGRYMGYKGKIKSIEGKKIECLLNKTENLVILGKGQIIAI